jgi:predicted nuclease of restriction endonuclease-like (RecB) superfamily
MNLSTDKKYISLLAELKGKIRLARIEAVRAADERLLNLYWEIGNIILQQQKTEGWGTKVIKRLALDLQSEFPNVKGFSERNLVNMKVFASTYPDYPFLHIGGRHTNIIETNAITQPVVAQLQPYEDQSYIITQPVVAQIPWTLQLVILQKLKTDSERLFYIQKTLQNNWSKNVLKLQIESRLHERQGQTINNFTATLPSPQSDLARESFKNPYLFDFLGMYEQLQERELEKALIAHIKKFLLELGKGFAYVGNQYKIKVSESEYILDVLFFNFHLNCFVVFELKVGQFEPEFAGKLNFYINAVDKTIKGEHHQPTIGILLCKTPDKTVVEYALKGIDTPLGVSNYELSKALPKKFKTDLPSIEELEAEIDKEYEALKKPVDKKMEQVRLVMKKLKGSAVKEIKTTESIERVLNDIVLPLRDNLNKSLAEIAQDFDQVQTSIWTGGKCFSEDIELFTWLKQNKDTNDFKIEMALKGCKPAGTKAFNVWRDIVVNMHPYRYDVTLRLQNGEVFLLEKLYHETPDQREMEMVVDKFVEEVLDDIMKRIGQMEGDGS